MTLLRQLVIVIVTLFILLFVGTLLLSINNTRDYLNDQLRTISQDTATSLGLTLTPASLTMTTSNCLPQTTTSKVRWLSHSWSGSCPTRSSALSY